mmetsp:Transcript_62/g.89  ORF Transcript_62/g.89 Transcript_62/m.89 type:complete len:205 (-) Transcript_62:126-740(-)
MSISPKSSPTLLATSETVHPSLPAYLLLLLIASVMSSGLSNTASIGYKFLNSMSEPSLSLRLSSNLPIFMLFSKMPKAGTQIPNETSAPASMRHLEMAQANPWSSATPATNAFLPLRSIGSPWALQEVRPRMDVEGWRIEEAILPAEILVVAKLMPLLEVTAARERRGDAKREAANMPTQQHTATKPTNDTLARFLFLFSRKGV